MAAPGDTVPKSPADHAARSVGAWRRRATQSRHRYDDGASRLAGRSCKPASDYAVGTCRSGIGVAANSFWIGFIISRAHWVDRETRALSVDRPVLAYI